MTPPTSSSPSISICHLPSYHDPPPPPHFYLSPSIRLYIPSTICTFPVTIQEIARKSEGVGSLRTDAAALQSSLTQLASVTAAMVETAARLSQ